MGYSEESPELNELFEKFIKCDWGEGREDAQINESAIATGYGDVMGVYSLNGKKIWIKTDLDEITQTTIFLPEEW